MPAPPSIRPWGARSAPGDETLLLQAERTTFEYHEAELSGILAIDADHAVMRPVGVLAGSVLVCHHPIGGLPAGAENSRTLLQVLVRSPNGTITASGPIALDVVRQPSAT